MPYHDMAIRAVVERLNLLPLKHIAQEANIQSAYRIIVYYIDGRACHSASTLIHRSAQLYSELETSYLGFFDNKAIQRKISASAFQKFKSTLQAIQFDRLHTKHSDLMHTSTLWAVERATSHFYHYLILNPHLSQKPSCTLSNAIDAYLSEAVREVVL